MNKLQVQRKSNKALTTISKTTKNMISLPVNDNGVMKTAKMEVDNSIPVSENPEFAKGIAYLIATHNGDSGLTDMAIWQLMEACKRHKVYPLEIYNAYWDAMADEFLPKSGMEFRHLFKHIKVSRANTYQVPKEGMSMEEYQTDRLPEGDKVLQIGERKGFIDLDTAINEIENKVRV